jgi:hypothetical protein
LRIVRLQPSRPGAALRPNGIGSHRGRLRVTFDINAWYSPAGVGIRRGGALSRSSLVRVGVVSLVVLLATGGVALADPNPNNSEKLRAAVTTEGILEHEGALDGIADSSGGNPLAGAPKHDASAKYVADRAASAGLDVSFDDFDYDLDFLADWTPPALGVVSGGRRASTCPGSRVDRSAATSARCSARNRRTSPARPSDRPQPRSRGAGQQQHQRMSDVRLQRDAGRSDRSRRARDLHVRDEVQARRPFRCRRHDPVQ